MSPESKETGKSTLQPSAILEIRKILIQWGKRNYQKFPWREPCKPWHGLIAEILLQRTKAGNVVPVYENFIRRFETPTDLANASVEDIKAVIYPLGLHWRASLLKQLGKQLVHLNEEIPKNLQELQKLPGVGTYVASAWLSFHGGKRSVIIDTNVVRWICRLTGKPMNNETRRQRWLIETAEILTPEREWKVYNYAILDFTMQICTTHPKCEQCPIGMMICKFGCKHLKPSLF